MEVNMKVVEVSNEADEDALVDFTATQFLPLAR